jgi:hypothetical protein
MKFITHTNEIVTDERLQNALNKVADFWAENSKAIKDQNLYALHVTEEQKVLDLNKGLEFAEKIRNGYFDNFTIWQRVNTELTGECIALLPI